MGLNSTGSPDFKKMVKSKDDGDVVQVSNEITANNNKTSWLSDEKTSTDLVNAVALDSQAIPDGYSVLVVAKPNNSDEIYIGHSSAEAETKNHALKAGKGITLRVSNTDKIFILPKVSGEGVDIYIETD